MEVKVKKLTDNAKVPTYAHSTDAGADLYSTKEVTLKPLERAIVPTGISIALPKGYEAQVRPKSGLALKKGISIVNTPGTIDQDYRGEIGVIMINLSDADVLVEEGQKIAQMVFKQVEQAKFEIIEEHDETKRGESGFGSTGVK